MRIWVILAFELVYYMGMITAEQVDAKQELASLCGVLNASYARLVAIVAQAAPARGLIKRMPVRVCGGWVPAIRVI